MNQKDVTVLVAPSIQISVYKSVSDKPMSDKNTIQVVITRACAVEMEPINVNPTPGGYTLTKFVSTVGE